MTDSTRSLARHRKGRAMFTLPFPEWGLLAQIGLDNDLARPRSRPNSVSVAEAQKLGLSLPPDEARLFRSIWSRGSSVPTPTYPASVPGRSEPSMSRVPLFLRQSNRPDQCLIRRLRAPRVEFQVPSSKLQVCSPDFKLETRQLETADLKGTAHGHQEQDEPQLEKAVQDHRVGEVEAQPRQTAALARRPNVEEEAPLAQAGGHEQSDGRRLHHRHGRAVIPTLPPNHEEI